MATVQFPGRLLGVASPESSPDHEATSTPSLGASRYFKNQKLRFLLVGGTNTIVGYTTFALVQWQIGHIITPTGSLLVSHFLTSMLAFALFRSFVFTSRGPVVMGFVKFQVVYIVPLICNAVALPLLTTVGQVDVYLAQALIVIASTLVSYFGHRNFSFRTRTSVGHE